MKCCCRKNNNFEPTMVCYHGSNCNNYAHHEDHHHCHNECCCCCCPYIPMPIEDRCSLCEQQMKFVLSQLINLYPTNTFYFNMEDGSGAQGTPDFLYTPRNKGLLRLNCIGEDQTRFNQYINICKIASFRIDNPIYNPSINYLPGPVGPTKCGCEESIRSLLNVDDIVGINAGGKFLGVSTVKANEFGIVAVKTGTNIQFISSCKIEKLRVMEV